MPRLPSDVWKHYKMEAPPMDGKKGRAICLYCGKELLANATRAADHMRVCTNAPSAVAQEQFSKKKMNYGKPGSGEFDDDRKSKQLIGGKRKAGYALDKRGSEDVSLAIARMIYGTGIPFSVVEHPLFVKMIKSLNPHAPVPSREQVADVLLDKESAFIREKTTSLISQAKAVTVTADAWAADGEEGLINFMVMTPKPIFYRAIAANPDFQTAEGVAAGIAKIIEEVGRHKVVSVVSDVGPKIKAAWKILAPRYPRISFYGCASTALIRLTEDDILGTDYCATAAEKAKRVSSFFRDNDAAKATLRQRADRTKDTPLPSVPMTTSWHSYSQMYQSLMNNRDGIIAGSAFLDENRLLPHEIRALTMDEEFWSMVDSQNRVLEVLGQHIISLQSDSASVSQVFHVFTELNYYFSPDGPCKDFTPKLKAFIHEKLNSYWGRIRHPVMQLAYLLDPRFAGSALSNEEYAETLKFLKDQVAADNATEGETADICAEVINFRGRAGRFAGEILWDVAEKTDANAWWNSFAGDAPRKLLELVNRLMAMKPSASPRSHSLSSEKRSQAFGFLESVTGTPVSHLLKSERASKLVGVFQYHRIENPSVMDSGGIWFTDQELLALEIPPPDVGADLGHDELDLQQDDELGVVRSDRARAYPKRGLKGTRV